MKRELREAIPCTDQSGRHVVVNRYVNVIIRKPLSGPTQTADGTSDYRTSNGYHVNLNDDGTFTIVQTDEILTRET